MKLNALSFHFTVAQTRDIILDYWSTIESFLLEKAAAQTSGVQAYFQNIADPRAVEIFHRSLLARGYDVDPTDVTRLFQFLLRFIFEDFRKEEFLSWYAEKRRRREAREKRRNHIESEYRVDDMRYCNAIEALEAEMKEDCKNEAELLGLELVLMGTWSAESELLIPCHPLYGRKIYAFSHS